MATTLRPGRVARQTLLPLVASKVTLGRILPGRSGARTGLTLPAQESPLLALPVALLLALTLVVNLFAARESKLDLSDAARIEIHFQRHERHALPLDRAKQAGYLAGVQQELAGPRRRLPVALSLCVFADMGVDQIELASLIGGIGFGNVGLASAERLHLRAKQHDAGFELLLDVVVEARLPILGNELAALALRRHHVTC